MNLMDLTNNREEIKGVIASNNVYTLVKDEGDKYKLVLRKEIQDNPNVQEAFKRLKDETDLLTKNQFIKLNTYVETDQEKYWTLNCEEVVSLKNFITEHPNVLANEFWKENFIAQIFDCIDFLHRKDLLEIELNLRSILVTQKGNNLRLLPPCSTFLIKKEIIWSSKLECYAPELQNSMEIGRQADIYAIGYIIKKLYPLNDIPYKYQSATEKAANERIENRFRTVGEMIRYIEKKQKKGLAKGIFSTIGLFTLLLTLFMWSFSDGSKQMPQTYEENKSDFYKDSDIIAIDKLKDDVEKYLQDTTYLITDTAITLSEETKMNQKELIQKAIKVFRNEFEEQAKPLIAKIYAPELLDKDEETYAIKVKEISQELQDMQLRLAKQYQIEPTTATRVGGEVIQELADQYIKK